MSLDFDYVQLAGQKAPGEEEAWNADALMEGVRAGTGRSDFLAALEDRVKAEETQWAPLLQLHFPDLLDDYLKKVLVKTGARTDGCGCVDLAARRRELLKNRLEVRKDIGEDRLQGQEGLDSSEELLQRVRAAEEQLARTSAALKAIRCRQRRGRQSFYEEDLRLAWKRCDVAATSDRVVCWVAVAGQDEWAKPGAEGGMGASVLENYWRAQTRDLLKRLEIKAGVVGEARKDMEELMSSLCTVKKRPACPAGSPPAEILTMLLHASRNLSPGGQGIGYQRKKFEPVFTLSLMEKLLCRVRSSGTAPLAWHHSSGGPLHKSNKAGPREREWCTCYLLWANSSSKFY